MPSPQSGVGMIQAGKHAHASLRYARACHATQLPATCEQLDRRGTLYGVAAGGMN
jgi:hypothetical protein